MRCAEPLQGKAASSFFSVTYFRLEIKYKRKFVAMTHEEQISLFEALALNGAWSNAACTGYCLLAMQRAGLDEKTIEKVLHELHWASVVFIRWLSFRLFLLRWLGVHFCAIILLISAQSCSALLHTMTAQFCVVYGTLSRMRLGLEKPLRIRSTSCAFSSSVKERVMLEILHPKSFDRWESG